jgi:hypothetical protein
MLHLLPFLLLFLAPTASAGVTIISDLDDTIKITNADSARRSTINGVFSEKVFSGMPEFLREARSYSQRLHVLSSAPGVLEWQVRDLLRENGIHWDDLTTRNVLRNPTHLDYKLGVILGELEQNPDPVILIGDDVNHDPEIFSEVLRLAPGRVLAAYVHVVKGRPLPAGLTLYWTAQDLALRELEARRLSQTGAERVLRKLGQERKLKRVFPKFADCPTDPLKFSWQGHSPLAPLAQQNTQRFLRFCASRR